MINRKRVVLNCDDPSRAIQSQKDEADINTIVRNFGVTGRVQAPVRLPQYGDFDLINDYQTALHAVREAQAEFEKVPAKIRAEFSNDPGAFASFCLDPSNLPKLREWGLAPTPAAPAEPPPQV